MSQVGCILEYVKRLTLECMESWRILGYRSTCTESLTWVLSFSSNLDLKPMD